MAKRKYATFVAGHGFVVRWAASCGEFRRLAALALGCALRGMNPRQREQLDPDFVWDGERGAWLWTSGHGDDVVYGPRLPGCRDESGREGA